MNWQPIETAPQDGTWIIGRNAEGRVARIQSRVTHPAIPTLRHWAEGEVVKEGNWERSTCFYPVEWHAEQQPQAGERRSEAEVGADQDLPTLRIEEGT